MESILELFQLDIISVLIGIFMILFGIVSICTVIGKFSEIVGKPVKWVRKRTDDLAKLTETVNGIVETLNEMKAKENETKLKELKDSLIRYYNKYRTLGEWSKLEKDAFWDLFEDYEKRGGDGYIHTIVEPAMRDLNEID